MKAENFIYPDYDAIPPDLTQEEFYLDVTELDSLHRRIKQIGSEEVDAIVESRQQGAPHRLLTQLLNEPAETNLTAIRLSERRLPSVAAAQYHRIGLIYGMIACNDHHNRAYGERLQADDPDRYSLALRLTAFASYGMHHDAYQETAEVMGEVVPRWWSERFRELEHSATDAFTILAALTHPDAERLVGDRAADVTPDESLSALHTGMVDAKIFTQNYTSYKGGRIRTPYYRFNSPVMHPVSFDDEPFSLTADDTVFTALEKIRPGEPEVAWYDIIMTPELAGLLGHEAMLAILRTKMLTEAQIVQIGSNKFQKLHRIIEAIPPEGSGVEDEWPVRSVWLHRMLPQMRQMGIIIQPCQDVEPEELALRDEEAAIVAPWRLLPPMLGDTHDW